MSLKTDRERASERRHLAIEKSRSIHYKLGRVIDMYEEDMSDAEIADMLGCHKRTVIDYRRMLQLVCGRRDGKAHGKRRKEAA